MHHFSEQLSKIMRLFTKIGGQTMSIDMYVN